MKKVLCLLLFLIHISSLHLRGKPTERNSNGDFKNPLKPHSRFQKILKVTESQFPSNKFLFKNMHYLPVKNNFLKNKEKFSKLKKINAFKYSSLKKQNSLEFNSSQSHRNLLQPYNPRKKRSKYLSKCKEERSKSLERRKRAFAYIPQCQKDGSYKPVQCLEGLVINLLIYWVLNLYVHII